MPRQKIPIKYIDNPRSRRLCFEKRRAGLIKKAMELCILCGCRIGMFVLPESVGPIVEFWSQEQQTVITEYGRLAQYPHDKLSLQDYTRFGKKRGRGGGGDDSSDDDIIGGDGDDASVVSTSSVPGARHGMQRPNQMMGNTMGMAGGGMVGANNMPGNNVINNLGNNVNNNLRNNNLVGSNVQNVQMQFQAGLRQQQTQLQSQQQQQQQQQQLPQQPVTPQQPPTKLPKKPTPFDLSDRRPSPVAFVGTTNNPNGLVQQIQQVTPPSLFQAKSPQQLGFPGANSQNQSQQQQQQAQQQGGQSNMQTTQITGNQHNPSPPQPMQTEFMAKTELQNNNTVPNMQQATQHQQQQPMQQQPQMQQQQMPPPSVVTTPPNSNQMFPPPPAPRQQLHQQQPQQQNNGIGGTQQQTTTGATGQTPGSSGPLLNPQLIQNLREIQMALAQQQQILMNQQNSNPNPMAPTYSPSAQVANMGSCVPGVSGVASYSPSTAMTTNWMDVNHMLVSPSTPPVNFYQM